MLFCKNCNEETKHRVWPNGKIRCCNCDFKDNGTNKKYCKVCKMETLHNGDVCTVCYCESAVHTNLKYRYCNKCNRDTLHNGKYCTECNS